jgi:hypothetical protein
MAALLPALTGLSPVWLAARILARSTLRCTVEFLVTHGLVDYLSVSRLIESKALFGHPLRTPSPHPQYFYPTVWAGTLSDCTVSNGPCMNISTDSSFSNQECTNFECGSADVSCPPAGLPVCPGGANNCGFVTGSDYSYIMQKVILSRLHTFKNQICSCCFSSSFNSAIMCPRLASALRFRVSWMPTPTETMLASMHSPTPARFNP